MIAYGCLTYAVIGRGSGALTQPQFIMMFDMHDAVSIFQFLLMIPPAYALFKLSHQQTHGMSAGTLYTGVIALWLVILAFMLDLPRWISNGIYTVPEGVFGVWLMLANWRFADTLPRAIRWLGIIVGLGLLLFSFFLIGYTIFVSPIHLRIPAASMEEFDRIPFNSANIILHKFIWIGSIMGVFLFPFWSMLMGRKLLHTRVP
jgi:hypothetical protein